MESANLRHHHHQLHPDHQLLVGSSTLATPCLSVGNNHSFTSNPLLNSSNIHTSSGEVLFRDLNQRKDVNLQELACHSWLNNSRGNAANGCFIDPSPAHDHHQYLGDMKEEINSESSSSFSKFTDLLNSGNLSRIQENNNDEEQKQMNDLSEKLMLKTLLLSPNYHGGGTLHPSRGAFHQSLGSANNVPFTVGATMSQIHPTVNISNLRNMPSAFPGSMDVNLQALDLFSMDRQCAESVNRSMDINSPGLGEDGSQLGFTGMQQYSRLKQSVDPDNLPSFDNNGTLTGPKRPKPKAPQSVSKRPRAESSRISCPPLKVRKEKLGDRIAALQQMVAPFGKTDTASVLMEAFGYIKFLQNQVETLSVPYMKLASRNKCSNSTMQEGSGGIGGIAEAKTDLKSRGLCLVPLTCMSYITNDSGGGGIWPPNPPNFNPGF